jgi:uncharacterized caspase-like protein
MDYALLVGINAYPFPNKLNGCVNDVTDISAALTTLLNFDSHNISTILDKAATAANIKAALSAVINKLHDGDRFLFWYSGHGAQLRQGDVATDVICPVDFALRSLIWSFLTAISPRKNPFCSSKAAT